MKLLLVLISPAQVQKKYLDCFRSVGSLYLRLMEGGLIVPEFRAAGVRKQKGEKYINSRL